MKAIVGLGNPGRRYEGTRHNLGFMVVEAVARRPGAHAAGAAREQFESLVTETTMGGERCLLVKPQTYMNLSGQSVQGLLHFYKIPLENLLIAHDDLDIPYGTIRIRPTGGPGGQRGMANTIELLGTKDFPRLRLGIGRPPGRMDPKDYVLQDFSKDELKLMPELLSRAADAAIEFVMKGLNAAMNKYNGGLDS